PLKPVIRKATDADVAQVLKNASKREEAMKVADEKIKKHNLEMKLTDAEYTFDSQKVIFYFTAEGRIDFRELVRDLAAVFKVRIELRQIGIRDEAKCVGGIAPCGRACCCASFLGDFEKVSIKMAKTQGLSLNPTKISGLCGRLMCCLSYENEHYAETVSLMPKIGASVTTPDGKGMVQSNDLLKRIVTVRVEKGDDIEIKSYPLADVNFKERMTIDQPDAVNEDIKDILD
ncbi:MAG: stage 0 sporulation family protein, partial [Clostridia bacterium]